MKKTEVAQLSFFRTTIDNLGPSKIRVPIKKYLSPLEESPGGFLSSSNVSLSEHNSQLIALHQEFALSTLDFLSRDSWLCSRESTP